VLQPSPWVCGQLQGKMKKMSFMWGSLKHETWKCFSQAEGEMRIWVKHKLKTCWTFTQTMKKHVMVQLACLKQSCFSRVKIVWKVRTLSVKKTLDHLKCLSCGEAWNNMKHGNAFHKPKVKWGNVSRTSSKLVGYIESWTFTQTMK
jgi:hypothetical protein